MSDVAASGGYYMSMACDTIIANPATLTGSIGVISAIPNFSGTLKKLNITVDTIKTHKNALFLNPTLPITDEMKQQFTSMSREIYFRFIARVAESRKLSFDKTRSLAKGRVWTGLDAKQRGLVDTLGDLRTAINIAKARIGLKKDQKPVIQIYPKPEDDINTFLKFFKRYKHYDDDEDLSGNVKVNLTETFLNALSLRSGQDKDFFYSLYMSMPKEFRIGFMHDMTVLNALFDERVVMSCPYVTEDIH